MAHINYFKGVPFKKFYSLFKLNISFNIFNKSKQKALLAFLIIFCNHTAFCQIDLSESISNKIDTVTKKYSEFSRKADQDLKLVLDARNIVTSQTYKRYVDEYFTYLSYNRGVLPTGNSAALDILDKETQLKLSLSKKIESEKLDKRILIVTAGVQAKLEDNISTLFNGKNVTTGTTIFGNFVFLPSSSRNKVKQVVTTFTPDGQPIKTPFEKLNDNRIQFKSLFDKKHREEYPIKYHSLLNRWIELNSEIKDSKNINRLPELFKEKDEIENLFKIAGLIDKDADAIANGIQEEYQNNLFRIETEEPTWEWIQLHWFSGGITYTRNGYSTYDNSLIISERFSQKSFDSWGLRTASHWFKEKVKEKGLIRQWYFNLTYNLVRTNSFEEIKEETVTKSITRGNSGDTSISLEVKNNTKNITGINFKTGWKNTFGTTYTAMIGKKQSFGINLLGNVEVADFTEPIYNTHLGFLFRFKNNQQDPDDKKSPSKVNFEVFIQFTDISNASNSEKSVWQNKVIGASVSVPFNKVFFK